MQGNNKLQLMFYSLLDFFWRHINTSYKVIKQKGHLYEEKEDTRRGDSPWSHNKTLRKAYFFAAWRDENVAKYAAWK